MNATIEITRAAIDRRQRRYGPAFCAGVYDAAEEVSPGVFHIPLKEYAGLLRTHGRIGGAGEGIRLMKKKNAVAKNSRL